MLNLESINELNSLFMKKVDYEKIKKNPIYLIHMDFCTNVSLVIL